MSVLGIDLGNESGVIAQALRGGVDIILNEGSKRLSPVLVSFLGNERFMGEAAVSQVRSLATCGCSRCSLPLLSPSRLQLRTNMANTVTQLKRILGRKFSDPSVQADLETHLNYKIVQRPGDEIGVEVKYCDQTHVFSPQQLLAAFLTKLKQIVNIANPAVTTPDVVFSVPAYYTDAQVRRILGHATWASLAQNVLVLCPLQRRAVLDAGAIAGFNCLRVLNEGTAAALSYGIYKSAKKEFAEGKESKVLFLDMGHGHFTATVAAFTNASLKIVASASDDGIGGREIDAAIARWFAAEFKAKTGLDAWENRKARLKLMIAAEKAKVGITPYGVNSAPASVECLLNDRDFFTQLTTEKLEELSAPLMVRMQAVIRRAMAQSGTAGIGELLAVELVGGGMRPRIVKRRAAEALSVTVNEETGAPLSTSMNLDECISRGCALACAMLSPVFRVKPFEIVDACQYPIRICWEPIGAAGAAPAAGEAAEEDPEDKSGAAADSTDSSTVLFKTGDATPLVRRVTFRRPGQFELTVEEGNASIAVPAAPVRTIAKYVIEIPADPTSAVIAADEPGTLPPRVRVDFKHDHNGTFSLVKAEVLREIKEVPAPVEAAAAPVPMAVDSTAATPAADAAAPAAAPADGAAVAAEPPKPKKRYRRTDLPFRASGTGTLPADVLNAAIAVEKEMIARDNEIRARLDTRNSLEAFIYATRSALEESLSQYVDSAGRELVSSELNSAEEWLYGDGFEASKDTLEARRKALADLAAPLQTRKFEAENRYDAVQNLLKLIEDFRAAADNATGRHAHLSDSDRDTLRAACKETEAFLKDKQAAQAARELSQDPAFKVAEVTAAKDRLVRELTPIANKPVPPPAAVPPPAPATEDVPMVPAAAPAPAPAGETPMQE